MSPTASDMPWAMSAPVETTAWTMPVSIILAMTLPILAMVMAPERVRTTVQSGSFTMATVTSRASPRDRPLKAVFDMARRREEKELDLVEVEALECDEPVRAPVVELACIAHGRIVSGPAPTSQRGTLLPCGVKSCASVSRSCTASTTTGS